MFKVNFHQLSVSEGKKLNRRGSIDKYSRKQIYGKQLDGK